MQTIFKLVYSILFPPRCATCQGALKNTTQFICPYCWEDLPWAENFKEYVSAFYYQPPIKPLLTQLKFHSQLTHAKVLGHLLVAYIQNNNVPLPELIIPMPLHKKRLQERGFNQALEIARVAAKQLNVPVDFKSCVRVKATEPQTSLSATARRQNLHQAFRVKKFISAQHVAVIDDVITTGTTMKTLIQTLKQSGMSNVQAWSVAYVKDY